MTSDKHSIRSYKITFPGKTLHVGNRRSEVERYREALRQIVGIRENQHAKPGTAYGPFEEGNTMHNIAKTALESPDPAVQESAHRRPAQNLVHKWRELKSAGHDQAAEIGHHVITEPTAKTLTVSDPLLRPTIKVVGPASLHNMPCAIYGRQFAVLDTTYKIFNPSWTAQEQGWRLVKLPKWLCKLARRYETPNVFTRRVHQPGPLL
jgi:hypothetical protein